MLKVTAERRPDAVESPLSSAGRLTLYDLEHGGAVDFAALDPAEGFVGLSERNNSVSACIGIAAARSRNSSASLCVRFFRSPAAHLRREVPLEQNASASSQPHVA
jgi:hypothetical protein